MEAVDDASQISGAESEALYVEIAPPTLAPLGWG